MSAEMDMTDSEWLNETLRIRCPDGKVPTKLFKFLSSDSKYFALAMHELMLHNRIRLSSRTDFNDPFDTRFGLDIPDTPEVVANFIEGIVTRRDATDSVDGYVEKARKNPAKFREDIERSMGASLDAIGIYSFTEDVNHPLMWAHYANSHRGVALIFNHGTADTFGAFPMRYQPHYPRAMIGKGGIPLYPVFVKGPDWEYEGEWRIANPDAAHTELELPTNHFAGIVFGAAATQETYDFVLGLIRRRAAAKLPAISVYRAEAGESFDLDFFQFIGTEEWRPATFVRVCAPKR